MPDWITVIIALLIVGIVLDGVRRVRIHRRENIRLSRRAKLADVEVETASSSAGHSEFPSGGARVAAYRKPDEAKDFNKNVRESFSSKKTTVGAPSRIPEQVTLNLDETVPMLMESVDVEEKTDELASANVGQIDTVPTDEADLGILAYAPGETPDGDGAVSGDSSIDDRSYMDEDSEQDYTDNEPTLGSLDSLDDEIDSGAEPKGQTPKDKAAGSKLFGSARHKEGSERSPKASKPDRVKEKHREPDHNERMVEPEEVLIINVMAKKGERFQGEALMQVLMEQHVKFGDMDIFHRHTEASGEGPIMFSIANMVVPGTFNLAAMNEFTTPGISLFLSLPVEAESLVAFNTMAETARAIADALGGELKDENRSVMTKQTIEHARQKVVEFERKRKLHAR